MRIKYLIFILLFSFLCFEGIHFYRNGGNNTFFYIQNESSGRDSIALQIYLEELKIVDTILLGNHPNAMHVFTGKIWGSKEILIKVNNVGLTKKVNSFFSLMNWNRIDLYDEKIEVVKSYKRFVFQ